MKKIIFSLIFGLVFLGAVSPVQAGWNPDAAFRRAERAAKYNGGHWTDFYEYRLSNKQKAEYGNPDYQAGTNVNYTDPNTGNTVSGNIFISTNGTQYVYTASGFDCSSGCSFGQVINSITYHFSDGTILDPMVNSGLLGYKNTYTNSGISGYYKSPITGEYYPIGLVTQGRTQSEGGTVVTTGFTPDLLNPVAGLVYYDPDNTCSTATRWDQGAGLRVSLRGTSYTTTVASGGETAGQFSLVVPTQTYNYLDLSGIPVGFRCSTGCAQSCPTITSVTPPFTGLGYFVTDKPPQWWQVIGGSVYAGASGGGVTVWSDVPEGENLIETGVLSDIGALMRASGTVNTGAGEVSTEGITASSVYRGKIVDYTFFASQLGVTPAVSSDWVSDTIDQPAYVEGEKDYYYIEPLSGEASLAGVWSVAAGESYVVLVNGDMNINYNVSVAGGGFLMFVVNGTLSVDPLVTNMEGLYVIDDVFVTTSQFEEGVTVDVPLSVEGSVVAWGGVQMSRDIGLDGSTTPTETFTYRPDLLANMPELLKSFTLSWQEKAPGSFE